VVDGYEASADEEGGRSGSEDGLVDAEAFVVKGFKVFPAEASV
jgi:hypothetical protein